MHPDDVTAVDHNIDNNTDDLADFTVIILVCVDKDPVAEFEMGVDAGDTPVKIADMLSEGSSYANEIFCRFDGHEMHWIMKETADDAGIRIGADVVIDFDTYPYHMANILTSASKRINVANIEYTN